jgi:exopolysaccharide production protein ExoQ
VADERTRLPGPTFFYLAVVCVCLFIFGHDLLYSAHFEAIQDQSGADVAELVESGQFIRQAALTSMAAASCVGLFFIRKRNGFKPVLAGNLPYLFFILLGLCSVAWAGDPGLALRRAAEFLLFSITTFALSEMLTLSQMLTFACVASCTYLSIGVLAELLLRTFHPFSEDYRFCGTLHPNHQAWQCGMLVVSACALYIHAVGRKKLLYAGIGAFGMVFLLLTKSRTTLGAVMLAVFVLVGLALSGKRLRRVIGLSFITLALFSFVAIFMQSTLAAIYQSQLAGRGEDSISTLTGRLPLWTLAFQFIGERPLTGYGFYAFWTPDHIRYFSDQLGWGVPESHNGFIELLLSLGIPGLLLYLTLVAKSCYVFFRSSWRTGYPSAAFPVALYSFFLVVMFCDVIALDVNVVTMVVFALVWKAGSIQKLQQGGTSNAYASANPNTRSLSGTSLASAQRLEQPQQPTNPRTVAVQSM